ncbi:unnamed protein product, partial [Bubo scandiacus]
AKHGMKSHCKSFLREIGSDTTHHQLFNNIVDTKTYVKYFRDFSPCAIDVARESQIVSKTVATVEEKIFGTEEYKVLFQDVNNMLLKRNGSWIELCMPGSLLGPALGSQQPPTTLRAWGRLAGKLPGGRGAGDVWNSDCTADYSSAGGLKNGASYFWLLALQEVNNDVAVGKVLRGVLYLTSNWYQVPSTHVTHVTPRSQKGKVEDNEESAVSFLSFY